MEFKDYEARIQAMEDEINGITPEMKARRMAEARAEKAKVYNRAFWEKMHIDMPNNSLKEGSDGSGGSLVPDTYEEHIMDMLREDDPLRRVCKTVYTDKPLLVPVVESGGEATWMPETEPYVLSDPEFSIRTIDGYKVGTLMRVSEELLADGKETLQNYIDGCIRDRIGRAESEAYINGDGIKKPVGICSQAQVGAVTESVGEVHLDDLLELMFSVKRPYWENAYWLMSGNTLRELMKVRSYGGRNLWGDKLADKKTHILFGRPILISNYMDEIGEGKKPVLFGDFSYFWLVERGKFTMKRLSERYADQGQVGFLASKRVDAKLMIPEAVKSLVVKSAE